MEESVARLSIEFPWLATRASDSVENSSDGGCGGWIGPALVLLPCAAGSISLSLGGLCFD